MTTIDLRGPQGNAFFLLGSARLWCKQLGRDAAPLLAEMQAGDYTNLVAIFKREFGDIVDIVGEQDFGDK